MNLALLWFQGLFHLANLKLEAGKMQEAKDLLLRAISLDPMAVEAVRPHPRPAVTTTNHPGDGPNLTPSPQPQPPRGVQ